MAALYRTELKRAAEKEYNKLPQRVQRSVNEAISVLAMNPFSELLHVKKLSGADSLYRARFGDYKLVYEIKQRVLTIIAIKIGHRSDVYRGL